MSKFTHKIKEIKGIQVLYLTGEIDDSNIDELKNLIDPFLEDQNMRNLIINIKGLTYINSIVIGWFAGKITEFNKCGKHFVFSNPNEDIFDIIDAIGLSSIIETYDNNDECLLSFEK